MLRRITRTFFLLQSLLFGPGLSPSLTWGESALAVGGQPQVHLQFRIHIPQLLFLQVGTAGNTVDVIDFRVSDVFLPGMVPGSPEAIPVLVAGLVPFGQSVNLTANSTAPLIGGGHSIPFTTISWNSSGDFGKGTFDGSTNQKIGQWTGPVSRTGSFSFNYRHSESRPAGTYFGQVTYTLATP